VIAFLLPIVFTPLAHGGEKKSYKHASEFQMATLDQSIRLNTGGDVTASKTVTDAKLDVGGQAVRFLHTDAGDYRVEAPINKGASFLVAMATPTYQRAQVVHNKWFLDNVKPNTQVLFAVKCGNPNKKHPNDVVRRIFYFPDPDSENHEYMTAGDFTPYALGNLCTGMRFSWRVLGFGEFIGFGDDRVALCAG